MIWEESIFIWRLNRLALLELYRLPAHCDFLVRNLGVQEVTFAADLASGVTLRRCGRQTGALLLLPRLSRC